MLPRRQADGLVSRRVFVHPTTLVCHHFGFIQPERCNVHQSPGSADPGREHRIPWHSLIQKHCRSRYTRHILALSFAFKVFWLAAQLTSDKVLRAFDCQQPGLFLLKNKPSAGASVPEMTQVAAVSMPRDADVGADRPATPCTPRRRASDEVIDHAVDCKQPGLFSINQLVPGASALALTQVAAVSVPADAAVGVPDPPAMIHQADHADRLPATPCTPRRRASDEVIDHAVDCKQPGLFSINQLVPGASALALTQVAAVLTCVDACFGVS